MSVVPRVFGEIRRSLVKVFAIHPVALNDDVQFKEIRRLQKSKRDSPIIPQRTTVGLAISQEVDVITVHRNSLLVLIDVRLDKNIQAGPGSLSMRGYHSAGCLS